MFTPEVGFVPRPQCCRRIAGSPLASVFKPAGVPVRQLEQITLTLDEFEAVRLADLEGLYQEQAAERMAISRPTFGRIIASAHRKVAEALVAGLALRIEGGSVRTEGPGPARCPRCRRERRGNSGCPRCGRPPSTEGEVR
jgi:predicted DNA-binding protein (UPF0251 family)